ncbi:MAG: hypothetical protein PHP74_03875 [Candidatus Gracilibacteria bacterium]|nr:hypothetical protein [Candidatus Gracilibacteria bacterium]
MQLKTIKSYGVFLGICGLAVFTAISMMLIYLQCTGKINQKEIKEQDIAIEIKLPIIEWGKYESLSKHYLNGKIPNDK